MIGRNGLDEKRWTKTAWTKTERTHIYIYEKKGKVIGIHVCFDQRLRRISTTFNYV